MMRNLKELAQRIASGDEVSYLHTKLLDKWHSFYCFDLAVNNVVRLWVLKKTYYEGAGRQKVLSVRKPRTKPHSISRSFPKHGQCSLLP